MKTVKELKAIAKACGIKGYTKMNQQSLHNAIAADMKRRADAGEMKPAGVFEMGDFSSLMYSHDEVMMHHNLTPPATTDNRCIRCMKHDAPASSLFCTKCKDAMDAGEPVVPEYNYNVDRICVRCMNETAKFGSAYCNTCEPADGNYYNDDDDAAERQAMIVQSAADRQSDMHPHIDPFFVNDNNNLHHADVVPVQQVAATKRIQFIKADNVQLYFRADGQIVKIYWSADDFRLHLQSERRGDRHTKYAKLIAMMSKLNNDIDGDVARVVKAIVRLKDMPAAIKAARMKHLVDSGKVQRNQSVEKASSANSKRGCVDPLWLSDYVASIEDAIGRKPSGLEIRAAWLEQNA